MPPDCGLARPADLAVLNGPARHGFRPVRPCLDRRPGMMPGGERHGRHGVPCRPVPLRAVLGPGPCQAGPLANYIGSYAQRRQATKHSTYIGACTINDDKQIRTEKNIASADS